MRQERKTNIRQAYLNPPRVHRPCEDRTLMHQGKMVYNRINEYKGQLKEALARKNSKKAASLRQTINVMENSEVYTNYLYCINAINRPRSRSRRATVTLRQNWQ